MARWAREDPEPTFTECFPACQTRAWYLTYMANSQENTVRFTVQKTQIQRSDSLKVAQDEVVEQVSHPGEFRQGHFPRPSCDQPRSDPVPLGAAPHGKWLHTFATRRHSPQQPIRELLASPPLTPWLHCELPGATRPSPAAPAAPAPSRLRRSPSCARSCPSPHRSAAACANQRASRREGGACVRVALSVQVEAPGGAKWQEPLKGRERRRARTRPGPDRPGPRPVRPR